MFGIRFVCLGYVLDRWAVRASGVVKLNRVSILGQIKIEHVQNGFPKHTHIHINIYRDVVVVVVGSTSSSHSYTFNSLLCSFGSTLNVWVLVLVELSCLSLYLVHSQMHLFITIYRTNIPINTIRLKTNKKYIYKYILSLHTLSSFFELFT